MKNSSISQEGLVRIAKFMTHAADESDQTNEDVGTTETDIPQERQFNIGDETPIGVIRNIVQRDGKDVYFVGGNESGAFAQLMSEEDLKREILRMEQRQEQQRQQEENEIAEKERNDLHGFTDGMAPRQKGQAAKFLLNVSIRYKGEEYRPKEFVEKLLEDGYAPSTVLGKPAAVLPDGTYINLQKTSFDYMSYLANLS